MKELNSDSISKCHVYFTAPYYLDKEISDDDPFQGKKLTQCIVNEIRLAGFEVGETFEVFLGACYKQKVIINTKILELSVSWSVKWKEWNVSIEVAPYQNEKDCAELSILSKIIDGILRSMHDVLNIEWFSAREDLKRSIEKNRDIIEKLGWFDNMDLEKLNNLLKAENSAARDGDPLKAE